MIALIFKVFTHLSMLEIDIFQLSRCSKWPLPLSVRRVNDLSCFCRRCSFYFRQWFECPTNCCFLVILWLQKAQETKNLADIPVKSSHSESNLANMEARESCLLSVSNGLEAFPLNTSVQRAGAGFLYLFRSFFWIAMYPWPSAD